MKRRRVLASLAVVSACAEPNPGADADTTGIVETGTESTTATESLSDTTPNTSGDPTVSTREPAA